MKLKLDVVNKWQEPQEEVETVKFWLLPDVDGTVDLGATLPDGTDVEIGYFSTPGNLDQKIALSLWASLPKEYFSLDASNNHIYIY